MGAFTTTGAILESTLVHPTSGSTLALTNESPTTIQLTGSTAQTIVLPDATTCLLGTRFLISNKSTATCTVQLNDLSLYQTLAPGVSADFRLLVNNTANGDWNKMSIGDAGGITASSLPPVGIIVAYNPGYYTDGSNGTFTLAGPATNDVAGINAYLPDNWRVCDGSALNDPGSPIWVGSGRYLPNLSNDRFLMGATASGTAQGSNTNGHTHTVTVSSHAVTNNAVTSGTASVNTTTRTANVALTNSAVSSGNASVNTTTRTANVALSSAYTGTQLTDSTKTAMSAGDGNWPQVPGHYHPISITTDSGGADYVYNSYTGSIVVIGDTNTSPQAGMDLITAAGTYGYKVGAGDTNRITLSVVAHNHTISGFTTGGSYGGNANFTLTGGTWPAITLYSHSHSAPTISTQPTFTVDAHSHSVTSNVSVSTQPTFTVDAHTHSVTSNVVVADHGTATSSAPSDTENRPAYLSTFYIIRVK